MMMPAGSMAAGGVAISRFHGKRKGDTGWQLGSVRSSGVIGSEKTGLGSTASTWLVPV